MNIPYSEILVPLVPVTYNLRQVNELAWNQSLVPVGSSWFHWYGGPGKQKAPAGYASAGLGWLLLVSPGQPYAAIP